MNDEHDLLKQRPTKEESRWTIEHREVLHDNPWYSYRHDSGKQPGGTPYDYYYLHIPFSVGVVALTENNELILVRQYRYLTTKETLEVPGGKADNDESPKELAERELLEETGYKMQSFEHLSELQVANGYSTDIAHVFLATGGKKEQDQNLDDSETGMTVELHPLDKVYDMVWAGEITDSFTLSALMLASSRLL